MANIAVLCSNNSFLGDSVHKTGVSMLELAPVVYEIERAKHSVDLYSPLGGALPLDPGSIDLSNPIVRDYYKRLPFLQRLQTTSTLENIGSKEYAALIACGGWSCLADFYKLSQVGKQLAQTKVKYFAFVGYTQCLLLNEDIKQKFLKEKITAPLEVEDQDVGFQKFWKITLSQELQAAGYVNVSSRAWQPHVVESNGLITGQNAFSAQAVAEKLIKQISSGV